jgi:hypothetical protein
MAPIRARCDVDQIAGFDGFEAMPNTAWHDVCVAGPEENSRFDTEGLLVTIVKYQLHNSTDEVQELVAVRMDLTPMRSRPFDVRVSSNGVSVDSLWGTRRG